MAELQLAETAVLSVRKSICPFPTEKMAADARGPLPQQTTDALPIRQHLVPPTAYSGGTSLGTWSCQQTNPFGGEEGSLAMCHSAKTHGGQVSEVAQDFGDYLVDGCLARHRN